MRTHARRITLSGAVLILLGATAAAAELGGRAESIDADRAHFDAGITSSNAPNHRIYTLTPTRGGIVHEYANAEGQVFAVSWHGPGRPDLRQLLGARFDSFQSGLAARTGRRMSRHVVVRRSDFVVRSAGHPGAFFGVAYLPGLMPQGLAVDDLL